MTKPNGPEYEGAFQSGEASKAIMSLSQALLAPLDAIFKAQAHAARSFLSLILQLGYPHVPVDATGKQVEKDPDQTNMYWQEFEYEMLDPNGVPTPMKVRIPSLALLPIAPLSIDDAEFDFQFRVSHVFEHTQQQPIKNQADSDGDHFGETKRPWYLVQDPVSLRGVIAPKVDPQVAGQTNDTEESTIQIKIKLSRQPTPAGLDRLLSSLNQSAVVVKKPNGDTAQAK